MPDIDDRYARDWREEPRRLRQLAQWFREFAERTGNPAIWDARLRRADEFEREADRLEQAATRAVSE
jgi:hypothetical protein